MATKLDKSDITTIIAALRAFQEQYEDCDASEIYEDWEEDFTDENGDRIEPLGSNDINTLCKELSSGTVQLTTLPIVVMEGGIVQEVLNVNGYAAFDWDDFKDVPSSYWFDCMHPEERKAIRQAFDARVLRQIEELIAEDMAYEIELENKRREKDPFWMVPEPKDDGHKFIVNTANGFFSGREYFPEEEK